MSADAIQRVVDELEALTESDQQLVLRFLAALRRSRKAKTSNAAPEELNPALREQNGLLVFTGKFESSATDWLRLVRDERDETLMNGAVRNATHG